MKMRIAALLLCGCGAPKSSEQVVVPVASASAAPVTTTSAQPVASAPPPVASAEPAACPGECKGQITPELQTALVNTVKKGHRCYDAALVNDNTLQGKLMFELRVADDGALCSIKVGSNEMVAKKGTDVDAVPACMMRVFRTSTFPKPKGGCMAVNIPVNLGPKP